MSSTMLCDAMFNSNILILVVWITKVAETKGVHPRLISVPVHMLCSEPKSIEDSLNEIREKKRLKTAHSSGNSEESDDKWTVYLNGILLQIFKPLDRVLVTFLCLCLFKPHILYVVCSGNRTVLMEPGCQIDRGGCGYLLYYL